VRRRTKPEYAIDSHFTERDEPYNLPTSQSIKCSECGKIFKTTALANYHAEKSGHDQFEESTEEVGSSLISIDVWATYHPDVLRSNL
jgi:hypothetical protein